MMLQLWVLSIFFPFTKLLFESFGDEFWNKYWKSRTKDVKMCGSIGAWLRSKMAVVVFWSLGRKGWWLRSEIMDGSRILKFISVIFFFKKKQLHATLSLQFTLTYLIIHFNHTAQKHIHRTRPMKVTYVRSRHIIIQITFLRS